MKYKIIKSERKTLTLSIDDELNPVVKAPLYFSDEEIEKFVLSHTLWIRKAIEKKKAYLKTFDTSQENIDALRKSAKNYIPNRVEYWSRIMNVSPTGVKITSAKKRYGSCSSKNSLCFSLYLMQKSKSEIDYVIIHELSHIIHHNHSKEFYNIVSKYCQNYKSIEKNM